MSDRPAGIEHKRALDARSAPAARLGLGARVGLGAIVVALVVWIGAQNWDAPWIQGDELIFIVNNPDVTGTGVTQPTLERWLGIFAKVHEDLYQPIPILSYAIEWELAGPSGAAASVRHTDVFLHAGNALLVWLLLATLLARLAQLPPRSAELLAFAGSLLWAAHPTLAGAYAADMGRTHLLSATFVLLGAWLHVRSLEPERAHWFWAALASYVAAMMCKVVPGWFVVALALEAGVVGWRRALTAARIYAVTAICVGFAILNYLTTRQAGLTEDAALALFGDPLARSLLAAWIHMRNIVLPLGLTVWYPPDVQLSDAWGYAPVWGGALLVVASLLGGIALLRRGAWPAGLGLLWFWATLGPVLGIVGARAAAAHDRYAYLPLVGLALVVLAVAARFVRSTRSPWALRGGVVGLGAVALALAPLARSLATDSRTTIGRMNRAAARDPADPRLMEGQAMAYSFSANHATPESLAPDAPDFTERCAAQLRAAASAAEKSPRYFRDHTDRAAFHRRLSYRWLELEEAADALAQARRAQDFEPDAPWTWTRLAAALRASGQLDKALEAFEQLERVMPAGGEFRALRFTEWGDLLLHRMNRPDLALPKFRAALETGVAPVQAGVGAARCEVLAGKGEVGLAIAADVLAFDPGNVEAILVVAMYHLASAHFEQAYGAYGAIIGRYPALYEALRGFHESCGQLDKWREAALAWQHAVEQEPDNPVFKSFFAWAATLAGEESAPRWVERLLREQPENALAHAARMLEALRADDLPAAVEALRRCLAGKALPLVRELERVDAALRLLLERGQITPDAELLRALLRERLGDGAQAATLAARFAERRAESPLAVEARAIIARCAAAAAPAAATSSAPASAPGASAIP